MRSKQGRKSMAATLDKLAKEVIKPKFEDVVSDWKTEVTFRLHKKLGYRELRVEVKPHKNKAIFGYVDQGTKGPYDIKPKRQGRKKSKQKPYLAFRLGYSPRTAPIAKAHVGSGKASGEFRLAEKVVHPGIKARKFSKSIHDEVLPEFRRRTENVFRQLARSMKS